MSYQLCQQRSFGQTKVLIGDVVSMKLIAFLKKTFD